MREVLAAGWSLFMAGLPGVFPWVLAAEVLQALPFAGPHNSLLNTDFSVFGNLDSLIRALIIGALQAFLYSAAVQRLAALVNAGQDKGIWNALRSTPAVLIGYLGYEIVVIVGLVLTFAVFVLGLFVLGFVPALVLCILPLAPTAAASTALALFIYPAVLERRGPIAALKESSRLARTAWVRVSLVISVPALVLLLVWFVDNGQELIKSLFEMRDLLTGLSEQGSSPDIQALLSRLPQQSVKPYSAWALFNAFLGAIAWWYTLAVCYAEYRALKMRVDARAEESSRH
ncbi:MAG: hypothetical protein ACHQAZ_04305 [Gammaproteobacteria bacterium]